MAEGGEELVLHAVGQLGRRFRRVQRVLRLLAGRLVPQHLDVLAGIRAAWHQRGDVVLGDVLGGGVEGAGIGELGHHVPSGQRPAP